MSKNTIFLSTIIASLLTSVSSNTNSFAEPIDYQTKITPISNSIGIKKSAIQMNISVENQLLWGICWRNNHGTAHSAQISVNEDDSNKYKFSYYLMILTVLLPSKIISVWSSLEFSTTTP